MEGVKRAVGEGLVCGGVGGVWCVEGLRWVEGGGAVVLWVVGVERAVGWTVSGCGWRVLGGGGL